MKSHKGLEELIKIVAHRSKVIEESSGPTATRSEKLLYELGTDRLKAQLDDWQRGKPSVEGFGQFAGFFRSMGFTTTAASTSSNFTTPETFSKYAAICERMGFPADKFCDKVMVQLAMRETDDLPKPDVIFADGHSCDGEHRCSAESQGAWSNIPVFYVDVPLNEDDKPRLANLNYVADQLGEFIEWAEKKVPGVKYDEARHIEMLESDAIGQKYQREIYQLLKHVPCPSAPTGIARTFTQFQPSRYPNMQKAVECLRVFLDELREIVANGRGPYPEERLRLLWSGQNHYLRSIDPSKVLLERRAALLYHDGSSDTAVGLRGTPIGEVSAEYGVKLSPLQEEAARVSTICWGGPGKRWVNGTLKAARDIGAHGIIHWLLIGCTGMRGMGSVVSERAEKELGIPTLNIEGRQQDRDYMSQERFDEILSSFIDKCLDWAGKPRQ